MELLLKSLEGYGLLGGITAALIGVCLWQARQIGEMQKELRLVVKDYAGIAATITAALEKNGEATDERNRSTVALAEAVNRQADATKAQSALLESQHNRTLDRLGTLDKVVEALSGSFRAFEARRSAAS